LVEVMGIFRSLAGKSFGRGRAFQPGDLPLALLQSQPFVSGGDQVEQKNADDQQRSDDNSQYFARYSRGDHELIQYLFQTVLLAFEYGRESLAISAPRRGNLPTAPE
jgi:hypothetical protein